MNILNELQGEGVDAVMKQGLHHFLDQSMNVRYCVPHIVFRYLIS